jgi:thiol-disulfide isomerase/thioredoxin
MKYLAYAFILGYWPGLSFGQHRAALSSSHSSFLKITVYANELTDKDTLLLQLYSYHYPSEDQTIYSVVRKGGGFNFKIPITSQYGFFAISKKIRLVDNHEDLPQDTKAIFRTYYWESGDNITIRLKNGTINNANKKLNDTVIGKGALKYNIQMAANAMSNLVDDETNIFDKNFVFHNIFKTSYQKINQLLISHKNQLTQSAYNELRADYAFPNSELLCFYIMHYYNDHISGVKDTIKHRFLEALEKQRLLLTQPVNVPDIYLRRSKEYPQFVLNFFNLFYNLKHATEYSVRGRMFDGTYYWLKRNFKGELRDKLITYYFSQTMATGNFNTVFKDALLTVKTQYYYDKLKSLNIKRYPGSLAFNFNLQDTSGVFHSLKEYNGKVIFLDIWFNGCTACANLYQNTLSKVEKEFEKNDKIKFISVSTDYKKNSWINAIKSGEYTGANSNNLYTNGQGFHHEFCSYYQFSSIPTVLLIDKNGRIIKYNTPDLMNKKQLIENINLALAEK